MGVLLKGYKQEPMLQICFETPKNPEPLNPCVLREPWAASARGDRVVGQARRRRRNELPLPPRFGGFRV